MKAVVSLVGGRYTRQIGIAATNKELCLLSPTQITVLILLGSLVVLLYLTYRYNQRHHPTTGRRVVIAYASQQGEPHMPLALTDIQSDTATASVTDQAGFPIPADPANPNKISYAVDDATVLQVTDNGDGTAALKALKPGVANLTASDSSGDAPDVEVITVGLSAGKLAISFGTPA